MSLRCRPAPASNAPNAQGAAVASLAGTMTVGLHGAATFADGIGAVVAQLGSARLKSRSRQTTGPTYRGRGHAVQTHGSGSEEETTVTVDVRVFKFDRVSLRPVVAYDDGRSSLRAAAYEIPLTELLVPTPMSLPTFDRIWSALPATHSRAAKVHQHARSPPLRTAVRALGGELAPAVARLDDKFDSDLSHPRHVPLAHCGGYPLVAAGADREDVQDLLLALKRLDEFSLANRVVIFNEEDLAQVKDLMKESGRDGSPSGKLDLGEARELLKEANDGMARVSSQIR